MYGIISYETQTPTPRNAHQTIPNASSKPSATQCTTSQTHPKSTTQCRQTSKPNPKPKAHAHHLTPLLLAPLQPRINLVRNMSTSPSTPIPTRLRHNARNIHILHIIGSFQNTHIQARAHVPRDVAVEWPHSRVVGVDLQHQSAGCVGV